MRSFFALRGRFAFALVVGSLIVILDASGAAWGQVGGGGNTQIGGFFQNNVGGVFVDTDGMLQNAEQDALGKLAQLRRKLLSDAPSDLATPTDLRKISLKQLEAALAAHLEKTAGPQGEAAELPDEIRFLAGLQRIRYVLAMPETGDIVLAGPAEGWKADAQGCVVGVNSGRPVLHLEDLLVALRSAEQASRTPISCSIDPTPEGVARLQQFFNGRTEIGPKPKETLAAIEQSLGPQNISVTGVPADSRFARVLVAADYRMKRLGMNFEKAPVAGLSSYLQLVKANDNSNLMPRWWMAPNYQPLLRDDDGLAWELRSGSVQVMTEDGFFSQAGVRTTTGQSSPTAKKWADDMTQHYAALASKLPIFAELENMMDLAIAAAVVKQQNLAGKAGHSFPLLLTAESLPTSSAPIPKQVPTQASFVKRGKNYVISASGGVEINSWRIAGEATASAEPADVRSREAEVAKDRTGRWWWD